MSQTRNGWRAILGSGQDGPRPRRPPLTASNHDGPPDGLKPFGLSSNCIYFGVSKVKNKKCVWTRRWLSRRDERSVYHTLLPAPLLLLYSRSKQTSATATSPTRRCWSCGNGTRLHGFKVQQRGPSGVKLAKKLPSVNPPLTNIVGVNCGCCNSLRGQ